MPQQFGRWLGGRIAGIPACGKARFGLHRAWLVWNRIPASQEPDFNRDRQNRQSPSTKAPPIPNTTTDKNLRYDALRGPDHRCAKRQRTRARLGAQASPPAPMHQRCMDSWRYLKQLQSVASASEPAHTEARAIRAMRAEDAPSGCETSHTPDPSARAPPNKPITRITTPS